MELSNLPDTRGVEGSAPAAVVTKYRRIEQPADVINVPGALLKLETLAQLSGESITSLYRAVKRGDLVLSKRGIRCTRVTSENARAYLAKLAGGAA